MKLLYLSHVSWSWTKQRPQFLAEELSHKYEVTYVQEGSFRTRSNNSSEIVRIKRLFLLPFSRYFIIRLINEFLYKVQLYTLCKESDIIWFTSPQVVNWIPKRFFINKITIYDCMDDMIELYPSDKKMGDNEVVLYKKAKLVLASSSHLAGKLKQRYGSREIQIVNNAISTNFDNTTGALPSGYNDLFQKDKTILTYVGSISSWMDFDLLKAIHNKFPQITINLWGPLHEVNIPENDGINLCGKVEHKYVSSILSSSDILIMPFVVNELIESVNPVKLYEYIFSGKPCLAPCYGESLQFENYVFLYKSHNECISIIEKIINGEIKQKSLTDCRDYVKNNTWKNRVEIINCAINNVI